MQNRGLAAEELLGIRLGPWPAERNLSKNTTRDLGQAGHTSGRPVKPVPAF